MAVNAKASGVKKNISAPKQGLAFKLILILFVLFVLMSGSVAAGVYFKLINVQELARQWNLDQYPFIARYFPPPEVNFESPEVVPESGHMQAKTPDDSSAKVAKPVEPSKLPPDASELEKQMKLKQFEETKRIGKLARLYGGMKPEEAVAIMAELDDETVLAILNKMEEEQVSRIMALLNPKRAARLTESMMKGFAPAKL